MGYSVVCHGCGNLLFEGGKLVPYYKLRNKTDGKCPNCGKRLSLRPLSIHLKNNKIPNSPATKL